MFFAENSNYNTILFSGTKYITYNNIVYHILDDPKYIFFTANRKLNISQNLRI